MEQYQRKRTMWRTLLIGLVIFTPAWMILTPLFGKWSVNHASLVTNVASILVVVTLAVLCVYYSRYAKADVYLKNIRRMITDSPAFTPAFPAPTGRECLAHWEGDLKQAGFQLAMDAEIDGIPFDLKAVREQSVVYVYTCEHLTREIYRAVWDAAVLDVGGSMVYKKLRPALFFAADRVDEEVLALSKEYQMVRKTPFYALIRSGETGMGYFLSLPEGKDLSPSQGMIITYGLGYADGILPPAAKISSRAPFQEAMEEKLQRFTLKRFLRGELDE